MNNSEKPVLPVKRFRGKYLIAIILSTLIAAVAVIIVFCRTQINLPHCDGCLGAPVTPVSVEVARSGAVTFRGKSLPGLTWPFDWDDGWNWLQQTTYWKKLFEPDRAKREKKAIYGWGVPILLSLDRDLEFIIPPFGGQTNIWLQTATENPSRPKGLSFCIADPLDETQRERERIWVFWKARYFEVPFDKGCLPIRVMRGQYYRIMTNVRIIWLPKASDERNPYGDLMVSMDYVPPLPLSKRRFEDFLRNSNKGMLLCVEVEKGVTVQEITDFISLCEDLEQPWTFYFEALKIE